MPLPESLTKQKCTVQQMIDSVHVSPPNYSDLELIKTKWAQYWPILIKSPQLLALEKKLLAMTRNRQILASPKRAILDYKFDGTNGHFWKAIHNTEIDKFKAFHSIPVKGVSKLIEIKKHETDPNKSWLILESAFPKFTSEIPPFKGVIAKVTLRQVNFDAELIKEEAENEQMGSSYYELNFAYDEVIRSVPRKAKSNPLNIETLDGPSKNEAGLLDISMTTTIRTTWNPTRRRFGEVTMHLVGGNTSSPYAIKSAEALLNSLKDLKTSVAAAPAETFPANTGFSLVLIGNPETAQWSLVLTDPHELPQSLRFPNTSESQGPRSSKHNMFKAIDKICNHLVSIGGADFISLKKQLPEIVKIK
jgi:hypothetical protein